MKNKYVGKWRIVEMEQWDQDFIDLVVPGHITLKEAGQGSFQFGAVEGKIDYRIEKVANMERFEFSWAGYDEFDSVCGRGWAVIEGNELRGRLYFHFGEDSWYRAIRTK